MCFFLAIGVPEQHTEQMREVFGREFELFASSFVPGDEFAHSGNEMDGHVHNGVGGLLVGGFIFRHGLFFGLLLVVLQHAADALRAPTFWVAIQTRGFRFRRKRRL
jgi:hypothetical protein